MINLNVYRGGARSSGTALYRSACRTGGHQYYARYHVGFRLAHDKHFVLRGGGWNIIPVDHRSTYRYWLPCVGGYFNAGFRLTEELL